MFKPSLCQRYEFPNNHNSIFLHGTYFISLHYPLKRLKSATWPLCPSQHPVFALCNYQLSYRNFFVECSALIGIQLHHAMVVIVCILDLSKEESGNLIKFLEATQQFSSQDKENSAYGPEPHCLPL